MTYDTAGRTASYNGWVYVYDAEGRMTSARKSTSCSGSIDKVLFTYDGEATGPRSRSSPRQRPTTTRDFIYQGDAIVQEKTNGTLSREYIDDEQGSIIKFCDPNCSSPTTTYLVTWNGHGDALGAVADRSLDGRPDVVEVNTYSSWHTDDDRRGWLQRPRPALPHTSVARTSSGQHFSGLGLYYMHARHYSPASSVDLFSQTRSRMN